MTAASEPDYGAIDVPETPTTDEEIAKLPVLDLDAHKASAASPYDSLAFAAAAREEVGTMEEQLADALRAIVAVPSERTLLLNAEARAMYEIAKRALEEVERRGS